MHANERLKIKRNTGKVDGQIVSQLESYKASLT